VKVFCSTLCSRAGNAGCQRWLWFQSRKIAGPHAAHAKFSGWRNLPLQMCCFLSAMPLLCLAVVCRQYDQRESAYSAPPDEHTLWLWRDADWRKWERDEPWDWDADKRRWGACPWLCCTITSYPA
jgi:hypothetical protein